MRYLLVALFATILFSCKETPSKKPEKEPVKLQGTFSWLIGDWQRTNDDEGKQTYEHWNNLNASHYQGRGYTMTGLDTIWSETIHLIKSDNQWSLDVLGEGDSMATSFKVTSIGESDFVCENDKNPFPKKIHYMKEGYQLKAVISGGDDAIDFLFKPL